MTDKPNFFSQAALVVMMAFICAGMPGVFEGMARAEDEKYFDLMDIDQKLKARLPLNLRFKDEKADYVRLRNYFQKRPVLLTYVYYSCPMLCPVTLKSLAQSLRLLKAVPGEDYELIVVSFAPEDTPDKAAVQKETFLKMLGKKEPAGGIHFLSGSPDSITEITRATGFQYVKDEESGLYAHAGLLIVLTPAGKISRYFFGPDYPARDIQLALRESGQGNISPVTQKILMYCFAYDPGTGRYTLAVLNLVKLGGIMTILVMGGVICLLKTKETDHE